MESTTVNHLLEKHIIAILQDARFAPSVHNTQPWLVHINQSNIEVRLDKQHALSDGDPTGRQTDISIGIFVEALIISAAKFNLAATAITQHKQKVIISFEYSRSESLAALSSLSPLLRRRCSDRSVYSPINIRKTHLDAISQSFKSPELTIHAVSDKAIINKVADLTSRAIGVALSSPDFRKELAQYLARPHSKKQRGIATSSLHIGHLLAILEPSILRLGLNLNTEARLEKKRWLSASSLVIITADGDMPKYWLNTGRAYLRASLAIEQLGFSQATSAAIVEASNYHEDIEDILGTNQRILALIRIGKGSYKKNFSPRLKPEQLLTSN